MTLSDSALNEFSTSLVNRIRDRAKGVDDKSARIVNTRPEEFILTGFLTPRAIAHADDAGGGEGEDNEGTTDLPQDSAYEQTAIGLEWMVDAETFPTAKTIPVEIDINIYVRLMPTFEEQGAMGSWRVERASGGSSGGKRFQNAIPVWKRVAIPRIAVDIPIPDLLKNRTVVMPLAREMKIALSEQDLLELFPGRQPLLFSEDDLRSGADYASRIAQLRVKEFKPFWKANLDARLISVTTEPSLHRVAVRLVNVTPPAGPVQSEFLDDNLYSVGFRVHMPVAIHRYMVFQELPASFRYDRRMVAVGINSHVESSTDSARLHLTVESVPSCTVPRLEARHFPDADPKFDALEFDPFPVLKTLAAKMHEYDTANWKEKVERLTGLELEEAEKARIEFQLEVERFERAINVLEDKRYELALKAFRLANRAMSIANKDHKRWRLFQIVFIVSVIPELAAREYPELTRTDDGWIDLLWFAAGGGKTEAFLGVILWQAFFDRLRGKRLGTTAFVRFPLRLLTFQQLQRLGRAMAAAETIRKAENIAGARFSMGYLVGGTVTPNEIKPELHARFEKHGVDPRLQRIFKCPFCLADVTVEYDGALRLIEHRCTNDNCIGGKQRLPIYITDQDIYRYLPTVIVSTVDKLALLGQNQRFSNILGRVDFICLAHGATFGNSNGRICEAAAAHGKRENPADCKGERLERGPFHDPSPSLLIQDELHLLSEELGTFDAHYETGVMEVIRSVGSKPWKIIGATATIQDYRRHAWELYLRDARQFPAPGPEAYESFYYLQNQEKIGRIFVGILGVGRKHTPSVTKALSIFYQAVQAARESFENDPAKAAIDYGTGSLTKEQVKLLIFLYELALTYVLTRKGSDQVAEAIESRVRKELQEQSPSHGELLVDMFNGGVDVAHMITEMEKLKTASFDGDPSSRTRGIVTTNIIGHGVDVDRFNVIVFAGFTRLVAEYIQASARVGRTYPGISLFVATPQSERDRSIFDRFAKFHQYLDRLVDPAAVTRWPEPALERTVPGILCGYLMGVASQSLGRPLSTVEQVQDAYSAGGDALSADKIVDWMAKAYGCEKAPSGPRYRSRLSVRTKNAFASIVNAVRRRTGPPQALNMHLGSMTSLRDVDDPASISPATREEARALRRLIKG